MATNPNVSRKKTKKKSKFWKRFYIYLGVLAVIMLFLVIHVYNTMKKYEAGQPDNVAKRVVEELKKGDVSSIATDGSLRFEKDLDIGSYFKSLLEGKEVDCKVSKKTINTITYAVTSGAENLFNITLQSDKTEGVLLIFSLDTWKTTLNFNSMNITAPESFKVFVNDVELGASDRTGNPYPVDGVQYVTQYVQVPNVITYKVEGLIKQPKIRVVDNTGKDVDTSAFTGFGDVKVGFAPQEMPKELSDFAYEAAESYSNYYSADLPGCYSGTACLEPYFAPNSMYLELADKYRRAGDMSFYSYHSTPQFTNIQIGNYVVYSENCFSCRVAFTKSMTITDTGKLYTENNDQTYYFVKVNGKWGIADMHSN